MLFREVADYALNEDTERLIAEQKHWIAAQPENPQPYYQLAMFYRMKGLEQEALALLLHAVHLAPDHAPSHLALTEIYAVRADYSAAWSHARSAALNGKEEGVTLLLRHNVAEPSA